MTDHLLALIAAHFACSDLAVERMLAPADVQACGLIYQEIKLSFIPDMDMEGYAALPVARQSEINREGFLAFYNWRLEHPRLVKQLEAVARGQADLPEAS